MTLDHLAVGVKIVQIFCTNDKETMILKLIFTIENFIFKLDCWNSEKSVKMRSKQPAYSHVVKSTRHQALYRSRKQGYDEKAVLVQASWHHRKRSSYLSYLKVPNNWVIRTKRLFEAFVKSVSRGVHTGEDGEELSPPQRPLSCCLDRRLVVRRLGARKKPEAR